MSALSEDDELLAAELAFGLIEDSDRQSAEVRLDGDAAFAEAHARWQAYAAAMFADRGEAPRPSVWSAIAARLPANDPPMTSPPSRAVLRWWQGGALAAGAAALVLGGIAMQKPARVLVTVPVVRAPSAPMVAVLTGKKGVVTVSVDPATARLTSAPSGLDIGDHAPELWVIPADGKPRSMGVMKVAAPGWGTVPAPAASALASGVTIAVSVEPIGGSPTGQPTGPVILTGKLTAV